MKPTEKLKAAEKKVNKTFKEFKKAEQEFHKANYEVFAPQLKNKFEGKFFKGENTMQDKTWPVYVYCKEVVSVNKAVCYSYEKSPWGDIVIHPNCEQSLSYCTEEITKEQFQIHIKKIIKAGCVLPDYN